jgi:pimeloyl-ACP methyl ester carboxylesterase
MPTDPFAGAGMLGGAAALGAGATAVALALSLGGASDLFALLDPTYPRPDGASVASTAGYAIVWIVQAVGWSTSASVALAATSLRPELRRAVCLIGAGAAPVWIVASLLATWRPGWYYLLDPARPGPPHLLLALGLGSAAAWIAAAVVTHRPALQRADAAPEG